MLNLHYFDVELKKDKEFNYSLPSTHNTFIYLINGEIKIGQKKHDKVKDSTLILLSKGEDLKVHSSNRCKIPWLYQENQSTKK